MGALFRLVVRLGTTWRGVLYCPGAILAHRLAAGGLAIVLAWPGMGFAAGDQTVTNTNTSGPGSLAQAIADVGNNSTIVFDISGSPSTIPLSSDLVLTAIGVSLLNDSAGDVTVGRTGGADAHLLDTTSLGTIGGTGNLTLDVTTTGNFAWAVTSASSLSIGSVAATGSITATTGSSGAYALYAAADVTIAGGMAGSIAATAWVNYAYGIYAGGNVTIAGDMAGSIAATSTVAGMAYAAYADRGSLSIGSVAATGSITATAAETVYGLYAVTTASIIGEMAGSIAVTATTGSIAAAVTGLSSLSIGSVAATGSITATTGTNGAYALDSNGNVTIAGNMAGTITATAGTTHAYAIYAGDDVTIAGDMAGTITGTAGSSAVNGIYAGGNVTIAGDMAGSIAATSTTGGYAYAVRANGGSLSIGSVAATGSITATTGTDHAHALYASGNVTIAGDMAGSIAATAGTSDVYAIYAGGNVTIAGGMAGSIAATSTSGGIVYAVDAANGSLSIGSVAATGSVTATALTTVYGLCALNTVSIMGEMAGTIAATATSGPTAYAVYASTISIGSVAATGTISATATGQSARSLYSFGDVTIAGDMAGTIAAMAGTSGAYALYAGGNVTIAGGMTGTITATAGTSGAYGLCAVGTINGGTAATALAISGAVTAQAAGTAVAVKSVGAMNLSVTGTLSGVDTTGGGNGYAIQSGSADDTVTLAGGAKIIGKIDLGDGANSLTLLGTPNTATSIAQISGVTTLAVGDGSTSTNWSLAPTATSSFGSAVISSGANLTINEYVTVTGTITDNGTLTFNPGAATTYAGTVTGSGAVVKSGSATLSLTATNTYTGGTTLAGGTLAASSWASVGEGSYATSGLQHTLTYSGGTLTVAGIDVLAAGQTLNLGSSSLIVNTTSGDQTVAANLTGGGTLTKSGSGTLTLSGANSFSGTTLVSAGTLKAGTTSAFSATSAVTVEAGGTLALNDYSQTIAALAGAGSVTLGANTGTVLTVNSAAATSTTFSGTIAGSGTLTKSGSGTLTLSGANTYTGGTTVTGGTLAIASDTSLGNTAGNLTLAGGTLAATTALTLFRSLVVAGAGGTLDNGGFALTLASILSGSGGLNVSGSGITTLTSDSTAFAGTTTVSAGKLQVASGATLGGSVVVGTDGTLGGYGTVGSVTNSGTVSPGGSIGTLTIAGNYVQSASGNLLAEVSPTTSDLLNVTGTASLAGTLTVVPEQGYYALGQSWTILAAAGGVSGTFANTVISGSWNLIFTPTYTANGVSVSVSRLSYTTAAQSSRARAVAMALDAAAYGATGEMATLIAGLDFSTPALTNTALGMLSAESYDTYSQALLEGGRTLTAVQQGVLGGETENGSATFAGAQDMGPTAVAALTAMNTGASGVASGDGAPGLEQGRYAMFLKPVGLHTRQYGDANHTGYEAYTGGLTGGLLFRPTANLTLGIAPAFLAQSVELRSNGNGHGTIRDWSLAVLGAYRRVAWHVDGVARIGLDTFESSRSLALPGISRTARGRWNGWNASLSVGAGYDFTAGETVFGPIAAVEWQYLGEDGFTETGAGTIGQKVKARQSQALRTMLGARLARSFETGIGVVTPELRVGWAAQWLDQTQGIASSFIGAPQSGYRARASGHAYHAAVIDAGVSMRFSKNFSASVRAGVELFRPNHEAQAVSVGLRYSF